MRKAIWVKFAVGKCIAGDIRWFYISERETTHMMIRESTVTLISCPHAFFPIAKVLYDL